MEIDDFDAFYAALHDGAKPFRWQRRLFDRVASTGQWPSVIQAPTGSGKSCVLDIHIYLCALAAVERISAVPRRMASIVDRRALTDSTFDRAVTYNQQLLGAQSGILHDVCAALQSLQPEQLGPIDLGARDPIVCAQLRGAVALDPEWLELPSACTVIAATPQMLGSRILLRGYGTSRYARPREAGLLAYDTVAIIDEAHLNRQLVVTLQDIAALCERTAPALGVPGLQVVSCSATPDSSQSAITDGQPHGAVSVEVCDLDNGDSLSERLKKWKPVRYLERPEYGERRRKSSYPQAIAQAAVDMRREAGDIGTVGVVVNSVQLAIDVAAALHKSLKIPSLHAGGVDSVALYVGRMRPWDLDRLRRERAGLFTTAGDPDTQYLVATQTIEVGVDLDFVGLVTELAPATSLAQRVGRVNRLGLRDVGPVVVVGPPRDFAKDVLPYMAADLTVAREWVEQLVQDPIGLAPARFVGENATDLPAATLPRSVLTRFWQSDAEYLARTNAPLFAEPDLAMWLSDDLDDTDDTLFICPRALSYVVKQHNQPDELRYVGDDGSIRLLLEATPVHPDEAFPARVSEARAIVERALQCSRVPLFAWRNAELHAVTESFAVRSGDVIILDREIPVFSRGVVTTSEHAGPELRAFWGKPGDLDELQALQDGCTIVVAKDAPQSRLLPKLRGLDDEECADAVRSYFGEDQPLDVWVAPAEDDGERGWIVVRRSTVAICGEEDRQTLTARKRCVLLDQHQSNVATRAVAQAERIGLRDNVIELLRLSGLHHDDGKDEPSFQRYHLSRPMNAESQPWAKSRQVSVQQSRRDRAASPLASGWRHEQLSAARVWASGLDDAFKHLVTRLVGTSHGRGRPFFPHGADTLTPRDSADAASAHELFGEAAQWFDIVWTTQREFGVWGCAYLEALLRAADIRISKEGS